MKRCSIRHFCRRYLSVILTACLIATSTYVLFEVLDLDGAAFEETGQTSGFEAVVPDCGGEIKSPALNTPVPLPQPLCNFSFTTVRYESLAFHPRFSLIPGYYTVHTRNATRSESASPPGESEPAQRFA